MLGGVLVAVGVASGLDVDPPTAQTRPRDQDPEVAVVRSRLEPTDFERGAPGIRSTLVAWGLVSPEGGTGWLVTSFVPRWRWRLVPDADDDPWVRPADVALGLVKFDPWLAVAALELESDWARVDANHAAERVRSEMSAACGCDWQMGPLSTREEDRRFEERVGEERRHAFTRLRETAQRIAREATGHPAADLASLYAFHATLRLILTSEAPQAASVQQAALALLEDVEDPTPVLPYVVSTLRGPPAIPLGPEALAALARAVDGQEESWPSLVTYGAEAAIAQQIEVDAWTRRAGRAMGCESGSTPCLEAREQWRSLRADPSLSWQWRDALHAAIRRCFPDTPQGERTEQMRTANGVAEPDGWSLVAEQAVDEPGFACVAAGSPRLDAPVGQRVRILVSDTR